MSRAGLATWPQPIARRTGDTARTLALAALGLLLGAASVTLTLMANGNVLAALAPLAAAAGLWLLIAAPLRKPLLVLIFLCLVLDKPGDAENLWQSPLAPLGGLLMQNLNLSVPIEAAKLSLLVMLLLVLLGVRVYRLAFRVPHEDMGESAQAVHWGIGLAVLTTAWLCAYGFATGGDIQMSKIQVQVFLSMLVMAYLLGVGFRGTRDYKTLATIVVVTACVKAALAVWIRHVLPEYVGWPPHLVDYTTTHGDSMLFATASMLLLSAYFERPVRQNAWRLVLILPIIFAGMVANNRRLVWVQLAASFLVMLAMNPRSKPARALIRAVTYAAPVILLYVAVGWNSGSRIFAPVQIIHSIGDANTNRSTLYRDAENYNLLYTFRANPVLGAGFGHPFQQAVALDDISKGFKEWRYLPHNSILGLWAFTGAVGFTGLWAVVIVACFLAARSYWLSRSPDQRVAVMTSIAAMIVYMIHCWGDIGFSELRSVLLVGPAIAISGQMALATGAWPRNGILKTARQRLAA